MLRRDTQATIFRKAKNWDGATSFKAVFLRWHRPTSKPSQVCYLKHVSCCDQSLLP